MKILQGLDILTVGQLYKILREQVLIDPTRRVFISLEYETGRSVDGLIRVHVDESDCLVLEHYNYSLTSKEVI